jgi:hypothetical protein
VDTRLCIVDRSLSPSPWATKSTIDAGSFICSLLGGSVEGGGCVSCDSAALGVGSDWLKSEVR